MVFAFFFLGLILRLAFWQIIKGAGLSQQAKQQYSSSKVTAAPRGNILASDGSYWVIKDEIWLVYANSNEIKDSPNVIANKLAPLLGDDSVNRLITLLSKKGAWIPLAQKVNSDTKKTIESYKIPGIGFEAQESRYYPEASAAAQLLGFVGKDESGGDIGYFGLEGYYNLPLSGKSGFVGGEKDAHGAPILVNGSEQVSAISGVDLQTNIDKRIQLLAEQKLQDGITKYGAKGGSVTIMDPFTGKIMAMTSFPSFDPRKYGEYSDQLFRNPVISNSFEPGSILKVLVMAAGIDAGVVSPDTPCDICDGPLNIDTYQIKTWNNKYTANLSMTDVIVNSDNVGMSFVGQKLGIDKMYDYLNKFGIGKATGIDLQGESVPVMRQKDTWSAVDLATASFGQGIAVTGIQMVRGVAAIANGGYLVTPRVVNSKASKFDAPVHIISQQAASDVTEMMVQAAEQGEAKWARISGYKVAAKTGTAQIPVAGHYDPTNTNHSFVGFAPADKPKFIMLVTLQSPQSSPWAAETAAPLWYSIARDLFPYLGVQPSQ